MLPSTPPNVSKYGTYTVDETCAHLGCCRDTLTKRKDARQITPDYINVDGEQTVYRAAEILRYWFAVTRQPRTEKEIAGLLESVARRGYEATYGCKPPETKPKKAKKRRK